MSVLCATTSVSTAQVREIEPGAAARNHIPDVTLHSDRRHPTPCPDHCVSTPLGLSRVSARRYLEHFVETGRVEVRLRYGFAGRPQRRYGWRVG